jgi:hypothetical protein
LKGRGKGYMKYGVTKVSLVHYDRVFSICLLIEIAKLIFMGQVENIYRILIGKWKKETTPCTSA